MCLRLEAGMPNDDEGRQAAKPWRGLIMHLNFVVG